MFSSFRRAHCQHLEGGGFAEWRKRLRQIASIPRRFAFFALFILFFVYLILSYFTSHTTPSHARQCVDYRLRQWQQLERSAQVMMTGTSNAIFFIGNGLFGIGDDDGELRIRTNTSRVLSVLTTFYPLISASLSSSYSSQKSVSLLDFRNGQLKKIQCFALKNDECSCITTTIYAHRTRPHVLVQDIQTTNPTSESLKLEFTKKESKQWNTGEKVGETHSWWRTIESDGENILAAAVCSIVPPSETVESKRELITRFICLFNYETLNKSVVNDKDKQQQQLSDAIVKEFAETLSVGATSLDEEHSNAWKKLNSISFGISKSLAPDALNADSINATRYALLSNTRSPLLEKSASEQQKKEALLLVQKKNMCYTGHSTLLVPSSLWKQARRTRDLIATIDIWLLTLEKRGCANLLKAGSFGVAEAFALSLFASKFTGEHLEVDMDPGDLHREITLDNLAFSNDTKLSIAVRLDAENRPFFSLSSTSKMFVCDAGCVDAPVALERTRLEVPIKLTRPPTPILYLSKNKRHLEQLRGTIHVIEVLDAPAHEQQLIALHKHGHRLGGLPVLFWVLLGLLVLIFHLFLFKLLYSEWKKNDSTPYNYYLRQRYMRIH